MDYDVIIAGGSFAGLAAAVQLRGKHILLVEPHAIGAVQTSACGTLLAVLEATGTMDSLLQVHDRLIIHLKNNVYEYPLPYPFCTFDYRTFCYHLWNQAQVELLHASVLGHRGHLVYTTKGVFDAEILIDATGWRAELATNARQRAESHTGKSFGLEAVLLVKERGLHFYYDKQEFGAFNVGWLFPSGAFSRAGLGSYRGLAHLGTALKDFTVNHFENSPSSFHGGYWSYRRQPATNGRVLRVGDAAGQCLPLTGEGIRPALYFGAVAGNLARRTLDGEMRASEASRAYQSADKRQLAIAHRLLLTAQQIIPGLPMQWIGELAHFLSQPRRLDLIWRQYWEIISPDRLAQLWPGRQFGLESLALPQSDFQVQDRSL